MKQAARQGAHSALVEGQRAAAPQGPALGGVTLGDLGDYAVIGLFCLAALVVLRYASALFVPMFAAVVAGTVLASVGDRAQRFGVPPAVAAITLVAATAVGLFFFGEALAPPLSALADRLPEIAQRILAATGRAAAPLLALKTQVLGEAPHANGNGVAPFDIGWVTGFLSGLTPALGEILIFLATMFFFVAGRAQLRKRVVLASSQREQRLAALRIINATEGALAHYFGTAALIYAGLGVMTAAIAWVAGLATPLLWGVLAFVASFVPFIGPAVTFAALVSGGLMASDGFLFSIWPAAAFLAVHLLCENAVMPSLIGRRFEINPFLVFISIVFWTWMWGPVGAVLAAPILLVARTVHAELTQSA